MISAIVRDGIDKSVAGGLAGIATAFVQESIEHMIPWLIVSAAVIICDLACGLRKSIMMGEQVRFSRAVRRTMGQDGYIFQLCIHGGYDKQGIG